MSTSRSGHDQKCAVTGVLTVSVLLAVAVWRRLATGVYALVALFAAGAAVFDIAEIRHQASDEPSHYPGPRGIRPIS
jgi:hypothetical protein